MPSFHTPPVEACGVGRPKFSVSREQLEYLLSFDFTATDIAETLGVSRSTIHRRLAEYNISVSSRWSCLTDDQLDDIVSQVQQNFANAGYRRIDSQLHAQDIRVSKERIRECMQRLDPVRVAWRWLALTSWKKYSVRGSNTLWHIDGNHKLIRY